MIHDPWEGYFPDEVRAFLKRTHDQIIADPAMKEDVRSIVAEALNWPKVVEDAFRKDTAVSCWHLNDGESAAMWAIYGTHHGIAVRSTLGNLKRSFAPEPHAVQLGLVQYGLDVTGQQFIPITRYALRKRPSFAHEHELRAS